MRAPGLAGAAWNGRRGNLFPVVTQRAAGNNLPGITGWDAHRFKPAPGYWHVGGRLGEYDGVVGADPRAPKVAPAPASPQQPGWSEGQSGGEGGPALPPLPYGGTGARGGWAGRTGSWGNPVAGGRAQTTGDGSDPQNGTGRQSWWRGGIQGFSDKLTVKDRHAYWDTGSQKTGVTFVPEGTPPGTYNNPVQQPPLPNLRTVNRTVSYQKGSDKTRNQDDLTRPYTWLGEQGSRWTPVYGGVPGLYQPYGTRGGVPFPIVSPAVQGGAGDGPRVVSGGPPHGLHSQTPWKGGEQLINRSRATPQMRPVRIDRPSNSPQAGQSYSQTVRQQGASGVRPSSAPAPRGAGPMQHTGRGWAGRGRKGWIQ